MTGYHRCRPCAAARTGCIVDGSHVIGVAGRRSFAMNHEFALELLEALLETMKEGERGFALATQDNREPGVADLLKDGEESCRAAVIELQDQVRALGGLPEGGGSAKVPVYRG